MWDQIEGKVKREIRLALSEFLKTDISNILCGYQRKLSEFAFRGKILKSNKGNQIDLIRDMVDHFDTTEDNSHKFDFDKYKGKIYRVMSFHVMSCH